MPEDQRRREAWRIARETAARARVAGFAGVVLMGLRFETLVGEAYDAWHAEDLAPDPSVTSRAPARTPS